MTPEQEILEDALAAARQRIKQYSHELKQHSKTLPLDAAADWKSPTDALQTEMVAFTKRYEMTLDLITRRLFRSVLAVHGTMLRTKQLVEVLKITAELDIIPDAARWDEITKLRNSFAHDYSLSFAQIVPLLNQAWEYAPDLIAMVSRVERFVAENKLLEEPGVK